MNTKEIQDLIESVEGGGVAIVPPGIHEIDKQISIPEGVTLSGHGAMLKAVEPMAVMLRVKGDRVSIEKLSIDCAGRVDQAILSSGFSHVTAKGLNLTGWKYGIKFGNSKDVAASFIRVEDCFITEPAMGAIYPLQIPSGTGGAHVKEVKILRNYVEGVKGSYTPESRHTADQIVLQGCDGFELVGNTSKYGGEVGITISRGCRNGVVANNYAIECDALGMTIGSGLIILHVVNVQPFAKGDTITIKNTTARGTIQFIDEENKTIWSNQTSGAFDEDSVITNGESVTRILYSERNQNIRVIGNCCRNNSQAKSGEHTGLAGLVCQQADHILLSGNQCFDDQDEQTQAYGIQLNQAQHITLGANDIDRNAKGGLDTNGTVTFAAESINTDLKINGALIYKRSRVQLIEDGAINVQGMTDVVIDTEGRLPLDSLVRIRGGVDGQRITLRSASSHRNISVQRSAAVDGLRMQSSVLLDRIEDRLCLTYMKNLNSWVKS